MTARPPASRPLPALVPPHRPPPARLPPPASRPPLPAPRLPPPASRPLPARFPPVGRSFLAAPGARSVAVPLLFPRYVAAAGEGVRAEADHPAAAGEGRAVCLRGRARGGAGEGARRGRCSRSVSVLSSCFVFPAPVASVLRHRLALPVSLLSRRTSGLGAVA